MKHQIDHIHCQELVRSLTVFRDLILAKFALLKSNQSKNVSGQILTYICSPLLSVSSEKCAVSKEKLLCSSHADVELDPGPLGLIKEARLT